MSSNRVAQPSQVAQSPVPSQTKPANQLMAFPDAMQAIIDGKRITKVEWGSHDLYGQLYQGKLMIHLADGWHEWIVNDGDLFGDDWLVLD